MNSTTVYVLMAIALVVVNGKVGRKRASPPSPAKPSVQQQCYRRLEACGETVATRYFNIPSQAELIAVLRSTSASAICSDASEYMSCLTNVLSDHPCDQVVELRFSTSIEAAADMVNYFCGPRLADVEENKNCFANSQFFASLQSCSWIHLYPGGNSCSGDAFNACIEAGLAQNSECGPGAPALYGDVIVRLTALPDGSLCPVHRANSGGKKHFDMLKRFLRVRF